MLNRISPRQTQNNFTNFRVIFVIELATGEKGEHKYFQRGDVMAEKKKIFINFLDGQNIPFASRFFRSFSRLSTAAIVATRRNENEIIENSIRRENEHFVKWQKDE